MHMYMHKADSCAEKSVCSAYGEEGHKEIMSGGQMKTSDVTPQSQESTITIPLIQRFRLTAIMKW